jgi:uncharacterized protein (TIGR02646 family)
MIHLPKSQPPPDCLAQEKQKASGTYRCDGVATQLKEDFKNKCYLCEQRSPTSINIEHFIPHCGDRDRMFDWDNLFFCCAHCNNVKAAWQARTSFTDLLNCTLAEDRVDEVMDYHLEVSTALGTLSKEHVRINPLESNVRIQSTAQLLNEIFQGTTEQKVIESANLREKLLEEVRKLTELMSKYLGAKSERLQQRRKDQILEHLQSDSSFTAFKRCLIRKHRIFSSFVRENLLS